MLMAWSGLFGVSLHSLNGNSTLFIAFHITVICNNFFSDPSCNHGFLHPQHQKLPISKASKPLLSPNG
jgi:hypothetical protein